MLEEINLKIHDKFQIEFDILYNFIERKNRTRLDFYFFLPKSLNINSMTYPKHIFYRSIKNYVRYSSKKIPITDLKSYYAHMNRISDIEDDREYEGEVREFICGFESTLRMFFSTQNEETIDAMVEIFIFNVERILEHFRRKIVEEKRFERVQLVDEYISFFIQQRILHMIKKYKGVLEEESKERLFKFYERERGYLSNFRDTTGKSYRKIIYKHRLLKKYIHSSLFLNVRKKSEGKIQEHIAYGIAAIIAMTIATVVTLKIDTRNIKYVILVAIAYAFKDRLKDSFKQIFYKKIARKLPDFANIVSTPQGDEIFICREAYSLLNTSKVPTEIREIRDRKHNIKRDEDILKYEKIVIPEKRFDNKREIREILYLDINSYLTRMDDPEEIVYSSDKMEVIEEIYPKEYHINLVIKIREEKKAHYKSFQIILDRTGLKKVVEK